MSSVPSNIIEMAAPRRELVESAPHTRPYFVEGYHTETMLAIEGQLAAIANSVRKFMAAKKVAEVLQLKVTVKRLFVKSCG